MVAFVPRPSYSNSANNLFASSCDTARSGAISNVMIKDRGGQVAADLNPPRSY
jgi:hypothetical protein